MLNDSKHGAGHPQRTRHEHQQPGGNDHPERQRGGGAGLLAVQGPRLPLLDPDLQRRAVRVLPDEDGQEGRRDGDQVDGVPRGPRAKQRKFIVRGC